MKRAAEKQGRKEDLENEDEEDEENENASKTFKRADPEVMAQRRKVKVRRPAHSDNNNKDESEKPKLVWGMPTEKDNNNGAIGSTISPIFGSTPTTTNSIFGSAFSGATFASLAKQNEEKKEQKDSQQPATSSLSTNTSKESSTSTSTETKDSSISSFLTSSPSKKTDLEKGSPDDKKSFYSFNIPKRTESSEGITSTQSIFTTNISSISPLDESHSESKVELAESTSTSGEEGENNVLKESSVKLYAMDEKNKKWVEKGKGIFKINVAQDLSFARMLMRMEKSLKLILNVPLWPGISIEKPNDKSIVFIGIADGNIQSFLLRLPNALITSTILEKIEENKKYGKGIGTPTKKPDETKKETDTTKETKLETSKTEASKEETPKT